MKKIILILVTVTCLLTGCGSKETKTLDLAKIETRLSALTTDIDGTSKAMFDSNQKMEKTTIESKYGIDMTGIEEFYISMPTLLDSANMVMIVKPKKGERDTAKEQADKLMKKYEAQWGLGYAPKEEAKIKNRLEEEYEGYLIYSISDDNQKVIDSIKQ